MAKAIKYKDINLIAALDRKQHGGKTGMPTRTPMLVLLIAVLIIALIYFYFNASEAKLDAESAKISNYIDDRQTKADYDEALNAMDEADMMAAKRDGLESLLLNLSSYPDMTGADIQKIYGYADEDIEIVSFSYNRMTGALSLDAISVTAPGIPAFVAQLRTSGMFSDVRYEGYTEQAVDNVMSYAFAVTAFASAPEPHMP